MKKFLTVLFVILLVFKLFRLGYKLLILSSSHSDNANTATYSMEFSPSITQFIGKHYEEEAKFLIETPNAIQSLKNPDVPISNLQQMQIVKVNLKKRTIYGVICISKKTQNEEDNNIQYFFMDKSQYSQLKAAIDYGKQNFSIKSHLYGSFILTGIEDLDGESIIEKKLNMALAEYEQTTTKQGNVAFQKMEFLISVAPKEDKKVIQFLLPDYAEIPLDYFQKNYFEVPIQEFKEMLID